MGLFRRGDATKAVVESDHNEKEQKVSSCAAAVDDGEESKDTKVDAIVTKKTRKPTITLDQKETFLAVLWLFLKYSLYYSVAWGIVGMIAALVVCESTEGRSVIVGLSCTVLAPVGCGIGILRATRKGWLKDSGIVRRRVRFRLEQWMERHQKWEEAAEKIAGRFPVVVESIISDRSYTILKWILPIFLPSAKAVFMQLDKLKHRHLGKLEKFQLDDETSLAAKLTDAVSCLCDAHLERWEFRLSVIGVIIFAASAGLGGMVDSAV